MKSSRDSVRTPKTLIETIKKHFNVSKWTDPVPYVPFFDPTKHKDALKMEWKDDVYYVNPPYSRMRVFVKYANEMHKKFGTKIILLAKAESLCTQYFKSLENHHITILSKHVRFDSEKYTQNAHFGSVIISWGLKEPGKFEVI